MVMSRDPGFKFRISFIFRLILYKILGKVTKFGGNWLRNKKVTGIKTNWGWKTAPSAYRVKKFSLLFIIVKFMQEKPKYRKRQAEVKAATTISFFRYFCVSFRDDYYYTGCCTKLPFVNRYETNLILRTYSFRISRASKFLNWQTLQIFQTSKTRSQKNENSENSRESERRRLLLDGSR